jgi:hypothetical protein
MAGVGIVATVVVAVGVLGGVVVGLRSIPDINRYRRLKKM